MEGILSDMKRPARQGTIESPGLREMVETRKDDIGSLADRYGISNVRIFGSVARGDAHSRSDIDFLVDIPRDASLFDLSRFRRELSDLLGVDVDVVSSHALLPRDRDVLEEAIGL
jgi:predicted nucleotidyltransferase